MQTNTVQTWVAKSTKLQTGSLLTCLLLQMRVTLFLISLYFRIAAALQSNQLTKEH